MTINKIAVIGSGVMGSGIAAQVANAGVPVVLLDIKLEGKNLAADAIQRMLKTDPAPFMRASNAKLITPGNLEDDLDLLKDCDWIIEVVLEDLKVKHATYEKLNKVRKKGSIISSNTSTIPLEMLAQNQGAEFEQDFLVTHFFNPPRYMRLLELVTGPKTRVDATQQIREFCDVKLGKGVVKCNDTPGFIANRLGVYWLTAGVNEAIKQGVSVELADAVMSKPVGIPKTGVFGLIDLVGIDLMPKLSHSLLSTLPKDDAYRVEFIDHPFIHDMIKAGYTGRKGKGGFYRLDPNSKSKDKQCLQLNLLYPPARTPSEAKSPRKGINFNPDSVFSKSDKATDPAIEAGKRGLKAVLETDSPGGRYTKAVLLNTLHYAASLAGEIAENIADIDEAMKLGYNWKQGPFEMIDALDPDWFRHQIRDLGLSIPKIVDLACDYGSFYTTQNRPTEWKLYERIVADGEEFLLDGLNPWKLDWIKLDAPNIIVPHPQYPKQKHVARIYKLKDQDRELIFAATEFSNCAWGFYYPLGVFDEKLKKLHYLDLDGTYHPVKRPEGVLLLSDIKRAAQPVLKNGSAKVWDIGDGVLCFEHTSKMNTFDEQIFDLLEQTIKKIGDGKGAYKALVIYNEGGNFSAGANLGLLMFMINIAMWPQVEEFIIRGQRVFMALKFAPFPVVSAPSGLALGGGCEILLASDAVQAHAETYTGLVEVGVGLIPGWGGCKEMILRARERERSKFKKDLGKIGASSMWFAPDTTPMGPARKAFEVIGTATVAKSAHDAVDIGYFRESDGITMNRDRLLFDAKSRALKLAQDYKPPVKADDIRLPGAGGKTALDLAVADLCKSGKATPYDVVVSGYLASVLTGGTKGDWTVKMTEDDLLKLELSFMQLLKHEGTMARIEHMLDKGKPLRN